MATIFRNLFRHKKSQSKEEQVNEVMERDSSHRSWRSSKAKATRFADDNMLPATAAYHTNNAPKLRKGPQSCPGVYAEEPEVPSRNTFALDRESRRNRHNHNQMPSSSSQSAHGGSQFKSRPSRHNNDQFYTRWETSEYGSENPSPIGSHHRHYEPHLDDEEEYAAYEEEQAKLQDVKQRCRRHYEDKLGDYEIRRREDRRRIKDLEKEKLTIEKEKNDVVKIMIQQNDKLEKEKKKVDYYKRKMMEMEQQMNQMRTGFGGFPMFPQTPIHHQPQAMFPSFGSASSGPSQRFSFMSSSIRPMSSSNTPTTSAMDSTGGGAGESLVPASDLSLVQIPPMQSLHVDLPQNVPTGGPIGGHFGGFEDDEEDETKNFRTIDTPSLSIEMPRGSMSFLKESVMNETGLTELNETKDEGYSTTPDDATNSNSSTNEKK